MNLSSAVSRVGIHHKNRSLVQQFFWVLAGAVVIALCAQIQIPLFFTPVPITGQTFAVTLIALSLGRKLGMASVALYLVAGVIGLPVFASPFHAFQLGATSGYLLGMLASTFVVGGLADSGYARGFKRNLLAGFAGSLTVYVFGVAVLGFYVGSKSLLSLVSLGVLPFLPGDLIKTTLAASIASHLRNRVAKR